MLISLTLTACDNPPRIPDVKSIEPGSPAELYLSEFTDAVVHDTPCYRNCISPDGSKEISFDDSGSRSESKTPGCPEYYILVIKDNKSQETHDVLPLWEVDQCSSVGPPFPIYWSNDSMAFLVHGNLRAFDRRSGRKLKYVELIYMIENKLLWEVPQASP